MKNKHAYLSGREAVVPYNAVLVSKTDTKGIITYANNAFIDVCGYSRDELIGRNHNIVRHPDVPPIVFETMWKTLKSERPWRGTLKNLTKEGNYYWVRATIAPVVENGAIIGYVSVRKKASSVQIDEAERIYRTLWQSGLPRLEKYERFKFRNWSLTAKISVFVQAVLLVALSGAQVFVSNDLRIESRALAEEKGGQLAESIIDTANILMITGQYSDAHNRELLIKKVLSNKNVTAAQMVRTEAVVRMYGEGMANERLVNGLLKQATTARQRIVEFSEDMDGWPQIRVVTPYLASKDYHGTDCTACHAVSDGEALGASDLTISLKDDFQRIRHLELVRIVGQILLQVFLLFFVAWFVRRYIEKPAQEVHHEFRRIMEGNLDSELDISIGDTMGEMLCDIQSMQAYLRTTVDEIVVPVSSIQAHLASLAGQVSTVAQNSEVEQQHIQSIAAAMEQFSTSVSEVAEMAAGSLAEAKTMNEIVEQSNNAMENSVKASTKVGDTARESSRIIDELSSSVKNIGEISNTIKGIAEQTNLLALNAAIEAARAGEQGRGFAVVADEVRKLAERTSASTKTIASLIDGINDISKNAAHAMSQTTDEVNGSITLIRNCGEGLRRVAAATASVVGRVEHIAEAALEQDSAAKNVAVSLEQISSLVERNADLSRLSSENAAMIEGEARELRRAGYPLTKCALVK